MAKFKFICATIGIFISLDAFGGVLDFTKWGAISCSSADSQLTLLKAHTHISVADVWIGERLDENRMNLNSLNAEFTKVRVLKRKVYRDEGGTSVHTTLVAELKLSKPNEKNTLFDDVVLCRKGESDQLD